MDNRKLAAQIADLLKNPDLPAEIYNGIHDFIGERAASRANANDHAYIFAALAADGRESASPDAATLAAESATANTPAEMVRSLTFRDVQHAAARLALVVCGDDEQMGDLLLLLCATSYAQDPHLAEHLYVEMRNLLMPYMDGAGEVIDAFAGRAIRRAQAR